MTAVEMDVATAKHGIEMASSSKRLVYSMNLSLAESDQVVEFVGAMNAK